METNYNYKGFKISIINDEDAYSPDTWGNEDAFLVYDHRDFFVERKGFDPQNIYDCLKEGDKLYDGYYTFPVYAYIHSGVSLSLASRFSGLPQGHNEFDVSFKGFALVKRENGCYTIDEACNIAKSLLNEWNEYLSGNVWGYKVEDDKGNFIDSCRGFYGDPEESACLTEAKLTVDYEIKKRLKDKASKVKIWIKNHVPIDKRQELILAL